MGNLNPSFSERTVIVTGAGQGIGLELARYFHRAEANVFAIDLDSASLETARNEGIKTFPADVADTKSVEDAVQHVMDSVGQIDVLVNNAGILRDAMSWKMTDEQWESVLAVHVGGTFRFTRACTPHFRNRSYGRIINITSYSGLRGNMGQANYATAKAGIIGFTKTIAKELGRFGITANAISPNAATRMVESIPAERRAELEAQIPLGRFADPAEIASAVGFLASEDAGYITGAILPIDGGLAI